MRATTVDVKGVDERVSAVAHGFKEMREEATEIAAHSSVRESLQTAKKLYESERYQVRMVAAFLLGYVAARSPEAFRMLRKTVSNDGSWQVQEILAQAFNQYCEDIGYEKALPTIKDWLGDGSPNVRRAVTEGLRIWNRREYFKQHPEVAVGLLAKLRDDDSEYVRRSVGNALRDISRREKVLVKRELATWDTSDKSVALTYELASKFL
jgi:3-methyladenine DNA glycosylase AlkD